MLYSSFFMPSSLLSCVLIFVTIKGKVLNQSKKPALPPSPFSWPIVGNLPEVYTNKPAFKWINGAVKKLKTDIACFRLGRVHVMVVVSPNVAREFLQKHDSLFVSRPITMATEYSSQGFLTMGVSPWGEKWKKMRRIVTHELLSPTRLRWLLYKRNEETDNLLYYVYRQCNNQDGSVINLKVPLQHYCVNVIRKMTFSRRFFGEGAENGGPGFEEKEHVDALHSVLHHMYAFWISDYVPWLRSLDIDGHEKIIKNSMSVFEKYHDPIIHERVKKWRDGEKEEAKDLLDIMISLKDESGAPLLSIDEMKAQCYEFLFGVDGPPAGAEWALAEMINQPDILQKAIDGIENVVGKHRLVQESDVPQLNYLKACAREAFRLHPHAPYNLPHVSLTDTEQNRVIGSALGTLLTVMALARLIQGFIWSVPPNEERIDLSTSDELLLTKPLLVHGRPRLHEAMYPTL
ncbi:isoleucine N-monooxygenase 2-like [Olea europaea var. sylvestris]|uniref:isoleucine N-monooxygenase 2-like n=1 Tax=Olea europaea var. sylvestris TaxID=158386 RepID=UPI000C1D5C18|nr:isoleucine N-monooxygenase 2-like [Olea europaea var. sylvestris]